MTSSGIFGRLYSCSFSDVLLRCGRCSAGYDLRVRGNDGGAERLRSFGSFRQMTVYDVEYVVENGVNVDSTVTENPYNAVADKHFVAFDSEEAKKLMVVPANEVSANIPIILLRDPSLKANEYYLTLQLVENDEFKIGGVQKDVEYAITFADKLVEPNFWGTNPLLADGGCLEIIVLGNMSL